MALKFKGTLPQRKDFDEEYTETWKKYKDLYCTSPSY